MGNEQDLATLVKQATPDELLVALSHRPDVKQLKRTPTMRRYVFQIRDEQPELPPKKYKIVYDHNPYGYKQNNQS